MDLEEIIAYLDSASEKLDAANAADLDEISNILSAFAHNDKHEAIEILAQELLETLANRLVNMGLATEEDVAFVLNKETDG